MILFVQWTPQVHKTSQMNLLFWQMNLLFPMDPLGTQDLTDEPNFLADEPSLSNGPPSTQDLTYEPTFSGNVPSYI